MTNDPVSNQIQVYDTSTKVLLQTLSTQGKGGVGGNARGVKQYNGELFAAVNNGSNVHVARQEPQLGPCCHSGEGPLQPIPARSCQW